MEIEHADMGKTYVKVWGALAIITGIEFGVTYTALATITQNVIIGTLSVIKAAMVVYYFMHVKYESKSFKYIALLPLFLTGFLILFLIL